ncbi:hypothetical protein EXIGLDRAFT_770981, partial [Exidia glandulosa HHB12029]
MNNHRLGILLNPMHQPYPRSSSGSSTGNASSSDSSSPFHSRSSSVARKIRFAPLPDPRKDDVDSDGADSTGDDSTDTQDTKKPSALSFEPTSPT